MICVCGRVVLVCNFFFLSLSVLAVDLLPNPNPVGNTITIDGTVDTTVDYVNQGTISNGTSGVINNSATFTNSGTLVGGLGFTNSGAFVNELGGVVNISSYQIDSSNATGNTRVENSGQFTVDGFFRTGNTLFINNATGVANIRIAPSSTYENYGNLTLEGPNSSSGLSNMLTNFVGATVFINSQLRFDSNGKVDNSGIIDLSNGDNISQGAIGIERPSSGGDIFNRQTGIIRNGRVDSAAIFENSGELQNSEIWLYHRNSSTGFLDNKSTGVITNTSIFSVRAHTLITNAGTIDIAVGEKIYGDQTDTLPDYTQTAGETIVNGELIGRNIDIQGGILSGAGTITGNVTIGAGATVNPGNSPGLLTIDGDLTGEGEYIFEITDINNFDQLNIIGIADFSNSKFTFQFDENFTPNEGDVFEFILDGDSDNTNNNIQGLDQVDIALMGLAPGLTVSDFSFTGSSFSLEVTNVPVPAAVWLFGSALIGLVGIRRKSF